MAEIHGQQQIKAFKNSWGVLPGRGLSSSLSRWLPQLCDGGGGGSCQKTVIVGTNGFIPNMEVNDWCKSDLPPTSTSPLHYRQTCKMLFLHICEQRRDRPAPGPWQFPNSKLLAGANSRAISPQAVSAL